MMRKKIFIVFGTVFAVGLILGVAIVQGINPFYGSIGTYLDFINGEDLVRSSQRIVVAKYRGGKSHEVDMKNAYDDTVLGKIELTVHEFEDVETLKGSVVPGGVTYVSTKSSDSYDLLDGEKKTFDRETVPLTIGDDYVLFLREAPNRPEYGGEYGDLIWAYAGEPGIAVMQPGTDNMQFKVTKRYKDEYRESTLAGSNAPFELSKQDILSFVSSGDGAE